MRRVILRPIAVEDSEGVWTARFPELDTMGTGRTETDASDDLSERHRTRLRTESEYGKRFLEMMESPPPSWDEVTQEDYEERMRLALLGHGEDADGSASPTDQ